MNGKEKVREQEIEQSEKEGSVTDNEKSNINNNLKMPTPAVLFIIAVLALIGIVVYINNEMNRKVDLLNNEILALKDQTAHLNSLLTTSSAVNNEKTTNQDESNLATFGKYSFDLTGLTPRGNPDAKVVIVEYSDFQCPFCGKAQTTVEQILNDYNGKVKLYYKQFPLTQIHPNAQKAAEASLLAADQGKFWEYHDLLFENQDNLDLASLKRYAAQLNLDMEKFNSGLDSGIKAQAVNKDLEEGIRNGVGGTPMFFINGQVVSGAQPYSVFKQTIDSELNKVYK